VVRPEVDRQQLVVLGVLDVRELDGVLELAVAHPARRRRDDPLAALGVDLAHFHHPGWLGSL
jgi:hypothetical protein